MADDRPQTTAAEAVNGTNVEWDDSKMESIYANIATATANREEFFLLFGTHQNWRGVKPEGNKVEVSLTQRMVMNPFAAKRLATILAQSIKAYEDQFGTIDI